MNLADVQAVKQLLSSPQNIVIVPHKNPDGDAIGSTLALWHYLHNQGHKATVISPNDYPKFLKWMPGNDHILNYEKENRQAKSKLNKASLIFTLDFNRLGRSGQMEETLQNTKASLVMIDHHQDPANYATIKYSDASMSSTCEMVYNFIEFQGDINLITPEMANCLYAGIMTDTGSFKFASTTSKTHRVVADLIDRGARNSAIHNAVFDTNTPNRLQLLGCALKNMVILEDYKTVYITLSQDELDAHQFKKGDTEGFVNYGLTLEAIVFAVIFIENKEEGIIKISFRSVGDFFVDEFANAHFEGGGHHNAAGGKSVRSLPDTVAYFRSLLDDYKDKLNA
ncbi:MAG: DHH family phosphoesterase [Bacteroidota bacterium]